VYSKTKKVNPGGLAGEKIKRHLETKGEKSSKGRAGDMVQTHDSGADTIVKIGT